MRIISVIFLVINMLCHTALGASEADVQDLRTYVQGIVEQGYDIVNDNKLSDQQKREKSSNLIRSRLHLDWMAKYALGRHRRGMTEAKIQEFIKAYSLFVVKAYADVAANYKGEKAVIKNIKQIDEDLFIVNSEFIKPGAQSPIKVDYLVHKTEGKPNSYLVGDVITEGISILNSQQSEFNSVISSHGVDWLIEDLKRRAASGANLAPKSN
jgi:phospholipid transport system substrate-binding protein